MSLFTRKMRLLTAVVLDEDKEKVVKGLLSRGVMDFIHIEGLDPEMMKPYFQLENVKRGIFALADTLYGLKFVENDKIQKYHPDVMVYEVYDKSNGKFMAVVYMDFFPTTFAFFQCLTFFSDMSNR